MSYTKPILTEVFAEFFLPPRSIPQERFLEVVNSLRPLDLTKVEFGQVETISLGINSDQANFQRSGIPRLRCWNEEKSKLVQLSEDLFVVNQVGPYLGWSTFSQLASDSLAKIRGMLGTVDPFAIALNTVDKVDVPRAGFTVGKYLNCGSDKIPRWYADAKEACDIVLGRGHPPEDGFNRQFKIRVRPKAGVVSLSINSTFRNAVDAQDPITVLEALHDESTKSFESMITDVMRDDIMGGKK